MRSRFISIYILNEALNVVELELIEVLSRLSHEIVLQVDLAITVIALLGLVSLFGWDGGNLGLTSSG